MKPRIDLRFRPSLLIFVGDEGRQIREQLRMIVRFASLDRVLHQSIALLHVEPGSDRATPCPLGETFVDEDTPSEEDDLAVLIERTLRDVQSNQRIRQIMNADYPVPNPRTQFYIIGDANSDWLAHILQIVHQRLDQDQFSTSVCYVLSAYRSRPLNGRRGGLNQILENEHDPAYWSEREVANFCYLYEDMLTHPVPTFVKELESYHAAAEALFALIATSLTTEPAFEETVRLNPNWNIYENVGSLSTSLISFPRQELLEYCSARLGVALMEQWLRDIQASSIADPQRKKMRNGAAESVSVIEDCIKDDPARPSANRVQSRGREWKAVVNGRRWPSLQIRLLNAPFLRGILQYDAETLGPGALQHNQARARRDLYEQTEALFSLFWPEDVNDEYRKQPRRGIDVWTKLVYEQAGNAVELYQEWDREASNAWDLTGNRIRTEIKQIIDQLWSGDKAGFELATVFIDEFDDRMAKVASRLSRWREAHERDYERYLEYVEPITNGPWVVSDDRSNITGGLATGAAQASPTMDNRSATGNAPPAKNAGAAGGAIIGAQAPTVTPLQHLPEREERIARLLEQRVHWLQDQIPPVATQVAVALPFIFALTLTGMALFPNSLLAQVASVAISLFAAGSMHLALHLTHRSRISKAKEDLLTFYRRYYAYRCEKREDRLRTVLMGPLRREIQAIREKLDDINDFIRDIQRGLEERANRVHRELFHSPASTRDIFIANGERLQRERRNTLEDFAGQVTKLRMKESIEPWHQSSQDMKKRLILQFREQPEGILEMEEEEAERQIYQFAESVTSPYFKGPLVDLHQALDKKDIWREALDRAENPLYRAQVGLRDPQFLFVCGREADISLGEQYIRDSAYPVHISHQHEWVLIAAFFRGGFPAALDTDRLFPFRAAPGAPGSATPDAGANATGATQEDAVDIDATPLLDNDDLEDRTQPRPIKNPDAFDDIFM